MRLRSDRVTTTVRLCDLGLTRCTATKRSCNNYDTIVRPRSYEVRVVSRFLSRRFHLKSRWLFPHYFSNITLRTDLQTFGVTGAVFKIAGEMHRLLAYFDNLGGVQLRSDRVATTVRLCDPRSTRCTTTKRSHNDNRTIVRPRFFEAYDYEAIA